jgi:hypothetical protein
LIFGRFAEWMAKDVSEAVDAAEMNTTYAFPTSLSVVTCDLFNTSGHLQL